MPPYSGRSLLFAYNSSPYVISVGYALHVFIVKISLRQKIICKIEQEREENELLLNNKVNKTQRGYFSTLKAMLWNNCSVIKDKIEVGTQL